MVLRGSRTLQRRWLPQAPPARPSGNSLAPPTWAPPAAARRALLQQLLHVVPMARYEEVSVSGFEEFHRAVEEHNGKTIFAYFTGSKDAGGKSWCPDCVQGEAGIRGLLSNGNGRKAETTTRKGA